ncbi:Prosaposin receptor GPR37L1 [Bagarius yarrelli]|uniref:Prosaposin receptor GPR37L1 n=1 Tax=Bagarius yarrelli TaxID=175774 RepID=A0A556VWQ2_BAGYA|nr:Prosaposin receptor GPR37L1 [Bagarius yarrelli]
MASRLVLAELPALREERSKDAWSPTEAVVSHDLLALSPSNQLSASSMLTVSSSGPGVSVATPPGVQRRRSARGSKDGSSRHRAEHHEHHHPRPLEPDSYFTTPRVFNGSLLVHNPLYPVTGESYGAYAVMLLALVVFAVGVVANLAVSCAVWHNHYMQNARNCVLASLALWDLGVIFFCLPVVIFHELTKRRLMGDTSCRLVPFMETPESFGSIVSKLSVIWVGSLLLAVPELMIWRLETELSGVSRLPVDSCVRLPPATLHVSESVYSLLMTYHQSRMWWIFGCFFCLPLLFCFSCHLLTSQISDGNSHTSTCSPTPSASCPVSASRFPTLVTLLALIYGGFCLPEHAWNIGLTYAGVQVDGVTLALLALIGQFLMFIRASATPILILCMCRSLGQSFIDCCCCCCEECISSKPSSSSAVSSLSSAVLEKEKKWQVDSETKARVSFPWFSIMGTTLSEPCIYHKLSESIGVLRQSGSRCGMSERQIQHFIKQVLETTEPRTDPAHFPVPRAAAAAKGEDEDYVLEKTLGYLPLHHELDSGLGWTDGSFHQGELSGVETEEGLEECHAHQGSRGARVRGESPSSESFISSELSDSGFYSVSTAEFLRFQRLLEKRMRIYNSRLHHQGELQNLCMDAQKAHRELEAIPETLATQQDSECMEIDPHTGQMIRVASTQLHKNDRPCLNRHSSSSAAIFSTSSSPGGQQRALPLHGPNASGMLRRSRTLHHRPVYVEQRRRASHPASPNYCSVTLNRYTHALQQQLTGATEADVLYKANYCTHHHTHHAHSTLTSHAPHHGNANATLPIQHTHHHANETYAAHSDTLTPAQHTLHVHSLTAAHAVHPGHNHGTPATQAAHHGHVHTMLHAKDHSHVGLTSQNHTHTTLPTQHTHHTHNILPSHTLPQTHATLPTQHAHHTSRTRPKHAISQPSLSSSTDDHHFALPSESQCHDNRGRGFTEMSGGKEECEKESSGARDSRRFHTLSHTPSQEGNDTWPKTSNRHGPYGTLEGHMTTTTSPAGKPPAGPPNPRAMRNQLLRERALRLADERGGGISTDDETNVEIQRVGRYWSRSERREHVLQKQRQKEALRGAGASSSTSMGGDSSGYSVLMELSQRKLSRLRNRKLLDDWTTVEELLTHGTRLGTHDENVQIPNSLLTVTTV